MPTPTASPGPIAFSVVIPVYNAATSLERVVADIQRVFGSQPAAFEIVLVNDGSTDASEQVGNDLVTRFAPTVRFVQLARNFGEHHAVLAGLSQSRGDVVGIMDDDGQHPPEELLRLWNHQRQTGADVVYGNYREKQHGRWRNWGSRFNGLMATWLLGKPPGLYLSSFKVLSRFLVNELNRFQGPFPHLDGLILRTTDRIGQLEVEHQPSATGTSRYTVRKLIALWSNLSIGHSLVPLRAAPFLGLATLLAGALLAGWWGSHDPGGLGIAVGILTGLAGLQFIALAILGEYVGRMHLQLSGRAPYIIRYVRGPECDGTAPGGTP